MRSRTALLSLHLHQILSEGRRDCQRRDSLISQMRTLIGIDGVSETPLILLAINVRSLRGLATMPALQSIRLMGTC